MVSILMRMHELIKPHHNLLWIQMKM